MRLRRRFRRGNRGWGQGGQSFQQHPEVRVLHRRRSVSEVSAGFIRKRFHVGVRDRLDRLTRHHFHRYGGGIERGNLPGPGQHFGLQKTQARSGSRRICKEYERAVPRRREPDLSGERGRQRILQRLGEPAVVRKASQNIAAQRRQTSLCGNAGGDYSAVTGRAGHRQSLKWANN